MAPSPVELADAGGFSSPTTTPPQSSYRELDNAFLQNQTRIWLGEVLNMRFDKDVNISDLLADGQILFGVYKVFRKMLISVDNSTQQKFLERESVSSSEITEIFPYAKVERFLEVCQGLGVADIDLFTTSDVVDKRNTWKVCICLRSLSKKARSKNLNIPEFDSVTVTHKKKSPVNMPTDMVGNRRRNLERASSSPVLNNDDMRKVSKRSQQLKIEGLDGEEMAETTSPSQVLGSDVGDNFQLIEHESNHDHENNLPNHSPIPVDWQTLEEESEGNNAVKSDDTTADTETESNGDDCCSHIKLEDDKNAFGSSVSEPDHAVHSLSNEFEVVSTNDVEAIGSPVHVADGSAETMKHGVNISYENCRDISPIVKDEIEDLKDENKKITQQCKPPRKMLKLIAGGTGTVAAVGVMLYFLQLRYIC
ncbi:hypothetical protein V2J09_008178 [Rumex salicifolius]